LYETYYESGQLRERIVFKDGKINGLYESYYENGQLENRHYCIKNSPDGLYEQYSKDGRLQTKEVFARGVRLEGERAEEYLDIWRARMEEEEKARVLEEKRRAEEKQEEEKRQAEEKRRIEAVGNLKGRLEMLSDPEFRKQIGKARTPERQAKAEEIVEVRRARTLLSRAANKALDDGDKELFAEIEKVARPYALNNRRIQLEFRNKRAERRAKKDRG